MHKSFLALEARMVGCMEAVAELSKFHPPLRTDLRQSIVAWALGMVLGGPPIQADPAGQALQQKAEEALRRMLQGLIREDPSAGHLDTLLDQLLYWLRVSWPAPRARAAALLRDVLLDACKMPGLNIFSQDTFGHVVAKLSVSLADPEAEVREKAREVFGQLMQLQQKKRGRSQFTWEEDPERPWRESYAHLITAAEVFGGYLSARQRLSLQEAALEDALSLDGRWVREGGLLVLLSLLGQARALLEEEEIEDLRSNLSALLYNMWRGREVPPEIAALLPSSDE
ncbi:maestro heat-like repeat-containing protein family member 7 [Paroedura picta]|uniref:maestro heat-like repeat-containing protein family member 7 n=1 Tax=Paroedura picta TaxID=143630 RepID=UPI004056B985